MTASGGGALLGAVLLTDPSAVAPVFSGIFMEKMVGFVKLYFPVFLLGAVFGKAIELSGFSEAIVQAAIRYIGRARANAVIAAGPPNRASRRFAAVLSLTVTAASANRARRSRLRSVIASRSVTPRRQIQR